MDWLQENAWAAWLALALVLGVAEMFSLDLVLLMLAVGALAGMVRRPARRADRRSRSWSRSSRPSPCSAFVRPSLVKRLHRGPELQLGHGSWSARRASVIERITAHEPAGSSWPARSGPPRPTTTP